MPENDSSEEIKKLWPNNAPSISNIQKYVEKYKEDTIISSDLMILDIFNENIYLKMDQIEYSLDLNNNLVKVEG